MGNNLKSIFLPSSAGHQKLRNSPMEKNTTSALVQIISCKKVKTFQNLFIKEYVVEKRGGYSTCKECVHKQFDQTS